MEIRQWHVWYALLHSPVWWGDLLSPPPLGVCALQGLLAGERQKKPVEICKMEGYRQPTSPEKYVSLCIPVTSRSSGGLLRPLKVWVC